MLDQIEPAQIRAWWRQEPLLRGEGDVGPRRVFQVTNRSQGQEDCAGIRGEQMWLLTLLSEPVFTRSPAGAPKAALPHSPRAAEPVETPAATLSWVLDTQRADVPNPETSADCA